MIHCETWAGTPADPYTWLLLRDSAPTPSGAVRRLTAAAEWLADRLDADPDDPRPFPGATLRRWLDDHIGREDVAHRLSTGAYVHEAVSITGPGHVLYILTAMPVGGCVCHRPRPLTAATRPSVDAAVGPAVAGGWSR
ncbi:hypothetical protein ACFWV1_18440 [Streptomyces sp. NPDC058700]|uniref:hypothetical protein n=1 Tax=Streptomyces sp. NPDC058700 TaxID=3346607 RepID=UPI00364E38C5